MTANLRAEEILTFWTEAGREAWFRCDAEFDATIRERFGALCRGAVEGALDGWCTEPRGTLALILLLDQFPRNIHRGNPSAFAADEKARAVAEEAIEKGFDAAFEGDIRRFFYLPFMHAEDAACQERAITLCAAAGDEEGERFARDHADIIRRFGRFPHRNRTLGRAPTPEETRFLDEGGFSA
ncbi:MAG: DUF924 family protein [Methyloligellaceae bacterium]